MCCSMLSLTQTSHSSESGACKLCNNLYYTFVTVVFQLLQLCCTVLQCAISHAKFKYSKSGACMFCCNCVAVVWMCYISHELHVVRKIVHPCNI